MNEQILDEISKKIENLGGKPVYQRIVEVMQKCDQNEQIFHELLKEAIDTASRYKDMEKIQKLYTIGKKYKVIYF